MAKKVKVEESNQKPFMPLMGKYCPAMLVGNLLNILVYGLMAIKKASPSFAESGSPAALVQGIGIAAGVLDIGVGLYSIITGIKMLDGNKEAAKTQLIFGSAVTTIGTIMLLISLGIIIANPYVMVGLTLAFAIPAFVLLGKDIVPKLISYKNIAEKLPRIKDLKENLKKDPEKLLNTEERDTILDKYLPFFEIKGKGKDKNDTLADDLKKMNEKYIPEDHRFFIDKLQSEIGVEGAIAAFELLNAINDSTKPKQEIEQLAVKLENKIADYKRILIIRLVQQVAYVLLTLLSFVAALPLGIPALTLTGMLVGLYAGLSVVNIIPFFIDPLRPYLRSAPKDVGKTTVSMSLAQTQQLA